MPARVFGITENCWMGVFPKNSKAGDQICIFNGHVTLFIIRSTDPSSLGESPGEKRNFVVVGECYINGIMDGEGLDEIHTEEEHFVLV